MEPEPLHSPGDLTAQWLADALGSTHRSWTTEPIGTGQMSENHRITFEDGSTIVLKVASQDENSRATGVGLGAYEREVRFYREIAPTLGADAPLAACHHAALDPGEGWFSILLEDLAGSVQGDQIAGCSLDEAARGVDALAALQAVRWDDEELLGTAWLSGVSPLNQALLSTLMDGFAERYGDRVAPEHMDLCRRFVPVLDAWLAQRPRPFALAHGDYRLDNMLFAPDGAVTVVDWQTCSYGPPLLDLSYFLGGSLSIEDRRRGEEDLVRRYHEALLARGATGLDWDTCWSEYRRNAFHNVVMTIAASMLVERTPRGDEMFMANLARGAQQALDLEAIDLIDPSAVPQPLAVDPEDEGPHPAGPEPLWNESWYFDFTTTADGPAGYTRLGLYPNLGVAWVTLALVRAGAPTVEIVDFEVPLPKPGDALSVGTGEFSADHDCEAPLQRFSVRARGAGRAYSDPAAVLRGEPGRPADVAVDLAWETDGTPYRYRVTTRYEIPCRVQGTITIDGETSAIDGNGQRDHSWGARDWWSMDWCWSAGRLDDGTRFHATDLRLPELPRIGMGYVQDADGLHEPQRVEVSENVARSGLVTEGTIAVDPPGLRLEVTPVAHGPLLLVADDGRISHFPRSLCTVASADGRRGLAWVEWNLNQG